MWSVTSFNNGCPQGRACHNNVSADLQRHEDKFARYARAGMRLPEKSILNLSGRRRLRTPAILIYLSATLCAAQTPSRSSSIYEENLEGVVHRVVVAEASFVRTEIGFAEGHRSWRLSLVFDPTERIQKKCDPMRSTEFVYTTDGRLKHSVTRQNNASVTYKTRYHYDGINRLLRSESFEGDVLIGRRDYVRRESSDLADYTDYNRWGVVSGGKASIVEPDGSRLEVSRGGEHPVYKVAKRYDPAGKLVESTTYRSETRIIARSEYRYDSAQRLIEVMTFQPRDILCNRRAYSYSGNLVIGTQVYDGSGALTNDVRFEYEFDSRGNWVKKVSSLVSIPEGRLDLIPVAVTYRTITYH